jgi:3-hydroxyacyl-CoA dehydrogenase
MLDQLVEAGDLGKKVGKGIYDWTSGKKVER